MTEWFSDNNRLLYEEREAGMNYYVEDGDDPTSKYCAVYCSSNGLYFPNNDETFIKRVRQQNKYDWKRNRLLGVRKHIYIRDVQKQWYIEGINREICTVEKVAELIKKLAGEATEFVFLGSSAGGYMAMVLARILRGGVVFAGSPQIRLSKEEKNWLVCKYSDDRHRSNWFDISDKLNETTEYYIMYGSKNKNDIKQMSYLPEQENIHIIKFDTDMHGVVFYPFNVKDFLGKRDKLKKLAKSGKVYKRFFFSMAVSGLFPTIKECVIALKKKKY